MNWKTLSVGATVIVGEMTPKNVRDEIQKLFKFPTSHRKHWGYKGEDFDLSYYNEGKNYFTLSLKGRGDTKTSLQTFKTMQSQLKKWCRSNKIKYTEGGSLMQGIFVKTKISTLRNPTRHKFNIIIARYG